MRSLQSILVLGGAGFMGSSLIRKLLITEGVEQVIAVDVLEDTTTPSNLGDPAQDERFGYLQTDILDRDLLMEVVCKLAPSGVFHLAEKRSRKESSSEELIATNIIGTANVIAACQRAEVPLLASSTDEVYGSIDAPGRFVEESPLNPSTQYAATKASAELLALAAARSQGQEILLTRGSATYGPRQPDHQLIPSFVARAQQNLPLNLIGDGMQIRDWLHVDDHCSGLLEIFLRGKSGEAYNLSGNCERTDLGIARSILSVLEKPESLIQRGEPQSGIDARRSGDSTKAARYFSWYPRRDFQMHFAPAIKELASTLEGA